MTRSENLKGWKVNNVPAYAVECRYVVVKEIHDNGIERWFWGAYDDRNRANEAALDLTDRSARIWCVTIDLDSE